MVSITNRSNYVVTVEGERILIQRFEFSDAKQATNYRRELLKAGVPAEMIA